MLYFVQGVHTSGVGVGISARLRSLASLAHLVLVHRAASSGHHLDDDAPPSGQRSPRPLLADADTEVAACGSSSEASLRGADAWTAACPFKQSMTAAIRAAGRLPARRPNTLPAGRERR